MSVCINCGHPTLGVGDLCPHHESGHGDDWATGNRLMCDFLHRGIVSLPRADRLVGWLEAASGER
jgi:hypothetical protein